MSETLGTTAQLQLTIPVALETDWATTIRDNCFQKIVEHDHTGSGKGLQLTASAFAADALDFDVIRGDNDQYLTARNNANSADINIVKVDTSDLITFGTSLNSPVLTTPQINDTSSDHQYVVAVSELAADRTVTLPLLTGNDEFVFKDHAVTLTNKTITSAANTLTIDADVSTVSNIKNAEIKAAAAIALNKLAATTANRALASDASGFVTASSVTDTELGYVSGVTSAIQTQIDTKLAKAGDTMTGNLVMDNEAEVRFEEATGNGDNYVGFKAPASLGGNQIWTLPTADGGASTFLQTDGAGNLTFASPSSSGLSVVTKTTTYTATTSDDVILVDTSGGAWTLTLYAASGNSGKTLKVIKTTSDNTVALTIDGNGAETINGAATTEIMFQYETITLICDGSNWNILERTGHLSGPSRAITNKNEAYANGTAEYVAWTTEDFADKITFTNMNGTKNATYTSSTYATVPRAGKYLVTAQVYWTDADADADENFQVDIHVNGSEYSVTSQDAEGTISPNSVRQICDIIDCAAGDDISIRFRSAAGANLSLNSQANYSWFSIQHISI